jgi:glyoxylase-like metal-dependent hydrolase (beta-lactamase superfamily II)
VSAKATAYNQYKKYNQYVQSRRVGAVTVTAINDGMILLPLELTVPEDVWRQEIDADEQGKVPMDIHVLLVQTGGAVGVAGATILIDAGLDDPGSRWDESYLEAWPGSARTPGVGAGLRSMGIRPQDVTHILLTHCHFDHVVGLAAEAEPDERLRLVPRYPKARVLLGRADWENVPEEHLEPEAKARIRAIEEAGLLDLVDGEREVVPGVMMIPAPGESPGHSMIRVSSNGERLYVVGDLFHHRSEVEHLDWMVPWANQEQMHSSRRRLLAELADVAPTSTWTSSDALVVFTHENFPPWGRIVGDEGSGYHWQRA